MSYLLLADNSLAPRSTEPDVLILNPGDAIRRHTQNPYTHSKRDARRPRNTEVRTPSFDCIVVEYRLCESTAKPKVKNKRKYGPDKYECGFVSLYLVS